METKYYKVVINSIINCVFTLLICFAFARSVQASQIISSSEISRAASSAGIGSGTDAYNALNRINSVYADQLTSSERSGKIVYLLFNRLQNEYCGRDDIKYR